MSRASCPLDMTEVTSLSGGRLLTFADEIIDWIERQIASTSSRESHAAPSLGCHSTRYVPNSRGWNVYPVRTVRGAWGQAALRLRYVPNAGGWYA